MNKLIIILLFVTVQYAFGQDACTKFEQTKKLEHKNGNEGLKYVKTYWAKRCACESGATATGSFESAVKIANINYDHYQKNKEWYKTHFNGSSSLLPNKRMTVSDCKKENKSQINSINYGDCQSQTIGTDKDPQRFISDYMTAKCMCEKGVASKTESDQLFIQMQVAYDGYKMHYVNPSVVLQNPKDIEPCPIVKIGIENTNQTNDKFSVYTDPLLNQQISSFIKDLAANSNNPDLKRFAADLNTIDETNQKVDKYNEMFHLTPSQRDVEFNNVMNNAMQGVATAKFIVGLFKEEKLEPTPEQKQALVVMWKLRKKMLSNYNKVNLQKASKSNYSIEELDQLENMYYAYDLATAADRYLITKYFWSTKQYSISEIQQLNNQILLMDKIDIIKKIDQWSQRATDNKKYNTRFLNNAEIAFRDRINELKIRKAKLYKAKGDNKTAEMILNSLNKSIDRNETVRLFIKAVTLNDYDVASMLYLDMKKIFSVDLPPKIHYYGDLELKYSGFPYRNEVVSLIGFGIYSDCVHQDTLRAKEELLFFKKFIDDTPANYSSFLKTTDLAIYKAIESRFYIEINQDDKALKSINEAMVLLNSTQSSEYKSWIKVMQFNILSSMGDYENAHLLYNTIMSDTEEGKHKFFNKRELIFAKCEMLNKEGQYDRALKGLALLEKDGSDRRFTLLRASIYRALGQNDKLKQELLKL